MKRGDYIACVPATVFTLWLFFPNAFGPLAYGTLSGYTLPSYTPRRYVVLAFLNALPYFLGLAFGLPR